MKINKKARSIIVIILAVVTVCLGVLSFFDYIPIDILMISLGCTQLAGGFSQMSMAQEIDEKGERKDTRKVGRFSVIVGTVIIGLVVLKMIVSAFIGA